MLSFLLARFQAEHHDDKPSPEKPQAEGFFNHGNKSCYCQESVKCSVVGGKWIQALRFLLSEITQK